VALRQIIGKAVIIAAEVTRDNDESPFNADDAEMQTRIDGRPWLSICARMMSA
jgi:hypothetical protein